MSKYYKSHTVKRQVRRAGLTEQGEQMFRVKSFTKPDAAPDAPVYHPTVDGTSGRVSCDCKDFTYRHAAAAPTVQDGAHHCKHLRQTLAQLARRHELPSVPASVAMSAEAWDAVLSEPLNVPHTFDEDDAAWSI